MNTFQDLSTQGHKVFAETSDSKQEVGQNPNTSAIFSQQLTKITTGCRLIVDRIPCFLVGTFSFALFQ